MTIRGYLATQTLNAVRGFWQALGCELVVDASSHSLQTSMDVPDKNNRAWDSDLYKSGQLYINGYANPVKLDVDRHPGHDDPDSAGVQESTVTNAGDDDPALITSDRYQTYMRQDLISQLLTPQEQWQQILYVVLGVAALQFITLAAIGYTSGAV